MSKPISIRKRLVWYVLITTIVMSIITGLGVYRGTTHEADEIFNAALVQTARILDSIMTRQSIEANRIHMLKALERAIEPPANILDDDEDEGEELHEYEKKLFFVIRDTSGVTLLKSHSAPRHSWENLSTGFNQLEVKNRGWITFTLKASDDDLWIIVGERSDIRKEVTEYIGSALLTPLIFVLPVVLFFLWRMVGLAMKPLQSAVNQVRQQDIRKLTKVTTDHIPEEIEPLLLAINQMVEKLDNAYQRERRFVSDASHELRNPLAALLINIDNALEENTDSEVSESLASMKLSISRLSHLVSQLLLLSHSENPLSAEGFNNIDLCLLCRRVIESQSVLATTKKQTISFESPQNNYHITGVETLLISLISNLLDNAIKYCPEGSQIRLRCNYDNSDIVIDVDDSGEGLEPDLQHKALDRFFRANNQKVPGAGLGLSIAKSIADIHSATIELGESELGGLNVSIRFSFNQSRIRHSSTN